MTRFCFGAKPLESLFFLKIDMKKGAASHTEVLFETAHHTCLLCLCNYPYLLPFGFLDAFFECPNLVISKGILADFRRIDEVSEGFADEVS